MRRPLTEEEKKNNREARKAATADRNRLKKEAIAAEKNAAKSAKAKLPTLLTAGIATKASAAGIAKPKASPSVAWTLNAPTRYPDEYAAFRNAHGPQGAVFGFAKKAKATFGKADYEALAEEYAEEESPAAAAAAPAPAPALLSAPPSPALPIAALIEHIDTIHAEVGAIRSLLAGLRGGSQRQKRKQKTRRSRK